MRNGTSALGIVAILFALSGCDSLTGPKTLGTFSWTELEGETRGHSSDFVAIGRDVLVIGELTTPTSCYSLSPRLTESASRLTLRIEARNTDTANCAQRAASYRYEAQLNRLDNGAYDLIIVHDIQGGTRTEFEHSFVIGN